jgi:hypothetical protein
MNPSPSDHQWLTLHRIDDGEVWYNSGQWWAKGTYRDAKVTGQVNRLWQLGYIKLPEKLVYLAKPAITAEGTEILKRRSVYDVLERVGRRDK